MKKIITRERKGKSFPYNEYTRKEKPMKRTYTVMGLKYNKQPRYFSWDKNKLHPYYEVDDEKIWYIKSDSLEDALNWLKTNHPEYYQGSSVMCQTKTEVSLQPVPTILHPPL